MPRNTGHEITCNDDVQGPQSEVGVFVPAGEEVLIRVSGFGGDVGAYSLTVEPGGTMTGTVTDARTNEPVPNIEVEARFDYDFSTQATTDLQGRYVMNNLRPGTYYALIESLPDYLPEVYDDVPCFFGYCDSSEGTPIAVASGDTVDGIDFALDPGNSISGTITNAATGAPIAALQVELVNGDGRNVASEFTDSLGRYSTPALPVGTYFARTYSSDHSDELYDDLPCFDYCDLTTGTPIQLNGTDDVGGIDFALDRLGSITGTVTNSATGDGIGWVDVDVRNADGSSYGYTSTDNAGHYTIGGLPAATYFAYTSNYEFQDEIYNNLPCLSPGCDPTNGTPIVVGLNTTTEGIDFALRRLGAVSGRVVKEGSGDPVFAEVTIYNEEGSWVESGYTDGDGQYTISGIEAGTSFALAATYYYEPELYDGLSCPFFGCDVRTGQEITVALEATTQDIDFSLRALGIIEGTVIEAGSGVPLRSIEVEARNADGTSYQYGYTDDDGHFIVRGLPADTYVVWTNSYEHLDEVYNNRPCLDGCDLEAGDPVVVQLEQTTAGIDFALQPLGSVAGTVTDANTGAPVNSAEVTVVNEGGYHIASGYTDSTGEYFISGVAPGSHRVIASAQYYLTELYDDMPCEDGCDFPNGTGVPVALGVTTTGVDFALQRFGSIAGTVIEAATGAVLEANITVYDAGGNQVGYGESYNETGFRVEGLRTGTYFARAMTYSNHVSQVYSGLPCPDGCNVLDGTPIPVVSGEVTADIDFALVRGPGCSDIANGLCLNGGRFLVEAFWEDFEQHTGEGQAVRLTADSGYFWFFNPANVELVVKTLDACSLNPFNNFWVFAGGLTSLRTEVRVTDTFTQEIRTYTNPLGHAFQAIRDTAAFATCSAGREAAQEPSAGAPGVDRGIPQTTLHLNGGRFEVQASWATTEATGEARAVALSSDTGYFTFFNPNNVEVVVKVLNACSLAPFYNFWVFAAGLTDLEVELRVFDTVSGEVQVYTNPLGAPFTPVQDTGSFTCQ